MKTLINDTADVVFTRKSDGHKVFTAEATIAGISQAITENKLKAGIGNKTIAVLRSDKEITLNVTNALFDLNWLAATQGVAVQNGTATINHQETDLIVADNAGSLEVTITGVPVDTNDVQIIDSVGNVYEGTFTTGKVKIPVEATTIEVGDKVAINYTKSVTGNTVVFDSKKFSENYAVEYHTIEYNPATNEVLADLYIQFDNCVPSGSFDLSFENGTAISPALTFEALASLTGSEMGRMIEVLRP